MDEAKFTFAPGTIPVTQLDLLFDTVAYLDVLTRMVARLAAEQKQITFVEQMAIVREDRKKTRENLLFSLQLKYQNLPPHPSPDKIQQQGFE